MNTKRITQVKWILTLVGAIGGYIYWKYVGCLSGHCPLQQNWVLSSLWGASLGYLIGDLFKGKKVETNEEYKNKIEGKEENKL
jgi:hypothetical protein